MTIDATTSQALDRISHALAVQDATPRADADWQPGDPLYRRPRGDLYGEQTIRPMLDLIREYYDGYRGRCPDCEVSWVGPEPCWMCGKTPTSPGSASLLTESGSVTLTINLDVSPFVEQMQNALRRMVDAMGRTRHDVAASAAISDELLRLTLGGRGPERPDLQLDRARHPEGHDGCSCLVHIRNGDLQG